MNNFKQTRLQYIRKAQYKINEEVRKAKFDTLNINQICKNVQQDEYCINDNDKSLSLLNFD